MPQNNTIHIIGLGIDNIVSPPIVTVCIYAVCDYADDYYE